MKLLSSRIYLTIDFEKVDVRCLTMYNRGERVLNKIWVVMIALYHVPVLVLLH